jgi:hypothetical protein
MSRAPRIALAAALVLPGPAAAELFTAGKFSAHGDFRLRGEIDWDSQDGNGVPREDRTRLRARLRLGLRYEVSEHWRLEARLRSGAEASQQSPHVTVLDFDGNDTGDASFDLDRWFLQGRSGGLSGWAGRNNLPFWKQNEMLFDDDATMAGVAGSWERETGAGAVTVSGGYFAPPVGLRAFSGDLLAAQVTYRPESAETRWTLALGGYRFQADRDDPDSALLLQGNGRRDYSILAASAEVRWMVSGKPLAVGADLLHNGEDYAPDDPDPVTVANAGQTDGYVFQVTYGSLDERRRWLLGYTYAEIEALAVHSSYAQDDWVRWGSATQTRGSDLAGHELRLGWAFDPRLHVLARLFLVESITTVEDGNRLRVDLNWRF